MAEWEDKGFASEAAYLNHLKKEATEALELAAKMEAEKKAAEDALKAATEAKEAEALAKKEAEEKAAREAEEAKKKAEAAMSDTEVEAANNSRIAKLPEDKRKELAEEFEKADPELKALLASPRGVKAYLDAKLPASTEPYNPFKVPKKELTIEERLAAFLNKDKQGAPAASEQKGSGFVKLSDKAKEELKKKSDSTNEQVQAIRNRYSR